MYYTCIIPISIPCYLLPFPPSFESTKIEGANFIENHKFIFTNKKKHEKTYYWEGSTKIKGRKIEGVQNRRE